MYAYCILANLAPASAEYVTKLKVTVVVWSFNSKDDSDFQLLHFQVELTYESVSKTLELAF